MAITLRQTWGGVPRPWGYELRIDLTDGARILNRERVWPSAPSQAQIDDAVAQAIAQAEAELLPPAPQFTIICEDGTEVML